MQSRACVRVEHSRSRLATSKFGLGALPHALRVHNAGQKCERQQALLDGLLVEGTLIGVMNMCNAEAGET